MSSIPFTESNRGIDIITKALTEMELNVTHLTFPGHFQFEKKEKNLKLISSSKKYIQYYNRIMQGFSEKMTKLFVNETIKPLKNFDFSVYDYIILESGKPVFLIDLIPNDIPIIYRQSDSINYIISKNNLFKQYENNLLKRSFTIITVNSFFYNQIKNKFPNKTVLIRNGINIPKDIGYVNPYENNDKIKSLYFGLFPLSFKEVLFSLQNFKNIDFYFIGPKLFSKYEQKKLTKFSNFEYLNYQNNNVINNYIKYSDFIFIPYKNSYKLQFFGLSSKYLMGIYYEKPIISKKVGLIDEFNGLNIYFYNSKEELYEYLTKMNKNLRIKYKIDIKKFLNEYKIEEYKNFFRKIFDSSYCYTITDSVL